MQKKAFTLIELLVVIAIVGLLGAFALSGMRQAREQAKSAGCISNLRQLNVAALLFLDDHGRLPYSYLPAIEPTFFPNYLDGDREVLRCPTKKGYFDDSTPVYSYAWFGRGDPATGNRTVADCYRDKDKHPSYFPMFMDANGPDISFLSFTTYYHFFFGQSVPLGNPFDLIPNGVLDNFDWVTLNRHVKAVPGAGAATPKATHGSRVNIIYYDGHVGTVEPNL